MDTDPRSYRPDWRVLRCWPTDRSNHLYSTLMTKKQKRRWLHKADLTTDAARTLFTYEEIGAEHDRRLRDIARYYHRMKLGHNRPPSGMRKAFKRGSKLVPVEK
jgi:hypothetical protein